MSLDINALNTSIYTALNVSAITTLATGGIYHVKSPQGTAYPTVTYFAVINVQGDTFTEWGNDTLIQIDVWSDSNSAAESGEIVEAIAAQMDDKVLTISGYDNNSKAIRQNTRLLYEDEVNIFHYILEYTVRWHKDM